MGRHSDHKKVDDIAAHDINKGCRRIIDTSTPSRRRLRDVLRRQARKRLSRIVEKEEDDEP